MEETGENHRPEGGRYGRDRMIVGFTITCAIIAYHHYSSEYEPRSWRGVLDTTLCDFLRIVRFPLPIKLNKNNM
jgi:hypothetical protein